MNAAERAKSVFLKALDHTAGPERTAFVERVCAADTDLCRQVLELLRVHATDDSFLEKPAAELDRTVAEEQGPPRGTDQVGARIGPYKLLERIGEGGMGTVWMAEQQQPVRRIVALKLIKPGLDSATVLARFDAERQALALMDHPNIAKVLDAGATNEGRPYFVMELVKGTPITTFCDENRLTAHQRLELFRSVCLGIQHAHQKGVVHRDIKPSNVLVALYDDKPVPKVIDFGVAKAAGQSLTELTLHTGFGAIIGTLEYMSPEQATFNQLDIDTRSDVYSLGVVLYELLTGATPVDKQRLQREAVLEILRVVREEEPPCPSLKLSTTEARASIASARGANCETLARELRGELDWIVMKSLEKDRNRRYATAADLARDVERYLKEELIEARPPSRAYRARKFLKRHRTAVVVAMLLLLSLCGGIVGTTWGLVRAERERDQAEIARRAEASERARAQAQELAAVLAKQRTQQALTQSEGLRLVLHSELIRPTNPGLALVLAKDGAERQPGLLANNALLSALAECREERTLLGHTESVQDLTFSKDGQRLISASLDNSARLWELSTGRLLKIFDAPLIATQETASGASTSPYNVPCVKAKFSPDEQRVVTTSVSGQVRIWETATGRALHFLDNSHETGAGLPLFIPICPAEYSPDGRLLLTGYNRVRLWLDSTGTIDRELTGPDVFATWAEFNPDGTRVLTADSVGSARLWETATGKELQRYQGHPKNVLLLARLSPDGRRVVTSASTGGHFDGKIPLGRLWETESGREVGPLGNPHGTGNLPPLVLFTPDSRSILTADPWNDDPKLQLWEAETGKLLQSAPFSVLTPIAAFSPIEPVFAISPRSEVIELRRLPTLEVIATLLGHESGVTSLTFSPDGQRLASGDGNGIVRLWNVGEETQRRLGDWSQQKFLALSPNGQQLATTTTKSSEVRIWNIDTGRAQSRILAKDLREVTYATFRADGCTLLLGEHAARNKPALVADVETGRILATLPLGNNTFVAADLSPDGRWAMAVNDWQGAHVWDLKTGQEAWKVPLDQEDIFLGRGQFSPDSRWLLLAQQSGARLYELRTGKEVVNYTQQTSNYPFIAGPGLFSPEGRQVLIWYNSCRTGVAHLWEVEPRKEVFALRGRSLSQRPLEVTTAAFSADGAWILTGCFDDSVRVWDSSDGRERLRLPGAFGISARAINADKTRIVTGLRDRTARLWDAQSGQLLAEYRGHQHPLVSAQFLTDDRVLSADTSGAAFVWSTRPLETAQRRAPRRLSTAERARFQLSVTDSR